MYDYRLVKFRGKWAVIWYEGKQRHRQSLNTVSRADADRRLAKLQAAHAAARAVGRSSLTVREAWEGYVKSLGDRPSATTARHQWKAIGRAFGDRNAEQLTEEDCTRYTAARRKLGRSNSTIWSELSRLRSALRWAEKKRLIERAPFIWRPDQSPPRDKRMTREQVSAIIAACEWPHIKLFCVLAATTGARMSAILELEWSRIDLDRGLIHYPDPAIAATKKGRATVPINALAREALEEAQSGATSPYVIEWASKRVRSIKKGLAAAAERAGVPWVTAHTFRHSAASILAESGVPISEIAALLGHSNTKMVETVYGKYSPGYLRKAASALEF
jgi:integrase